MSFLEHLQVARQNIKPSDPWIAALRKIRGQIGHDGVERIATDAVFEQLDLPPLKRTPEAAKRLRGLMVELGWTPVRRHLTSHGPRCSGCEGIVPGRPLLVLVKLLRVLDQLLHPAAVRRSHDRPLYATIRTKHEQ